ncbi:hypothetical protein GpartN1_g19.t1 [Galdieria partita]|uniref:Uncharacterized protein n=1 Tax=Galdieria partita TaxID=83374 RepID=A0A9C7UM53_9RHOD|nr:hypothetical protein GpartN1_g19.t1 [Galdieria partita]
MAWILSSPLKSTSSLPTRLSQVMTNNDRIPSYIQVKENQILLQVLVKPGSKRPGLLQTTGEQVILHVGARPKQGEANEELIERLAQLLHLRKSDISIESGGKGKKKIVSIKRVIDWQTIENIFNSA